MAIAVTAKGANVNNKSATTVVVTISSFSVAIGDYAIVAFAGDTAATSVASTGGTAVFDTFVKDVESIGTNIVSSIWSGKCTTAGTLTAITVTNADSNAKGATVYHVSGLAVLPKDKTNTGSGTGSNTSDGGTGTLSQADEIVFAATAVEDEVDDPHGVWLDTTDTVNGNEQFAATNGGGDASNVQVHSVAEIVSSTNSMAGYDQSHDSSNWAAVIATYKQATVPVLAIQAPTSVMSTSATFNGYVVDKGNPASLSEKGVCYNTTGNPTTADPTFHDHIDAAGAYTESMTDLTPGTLYHCKAYAINSSGTGYSDEYDFYTFPADPANLASPNQTSTTIDLTWTKGTGGDKVLVRMGTSGYPASIYEGYAVYSLNTGTSVTVGSAVSHNIEHIYTELGEYMNTSFAMARAGERFNSFPICTITGVQFYLGEYGTISGYGYARIRLVSDDSIVGTFGSVDEAILGAGEWVSFDTDVVNSAIRDVRIIIECAPGMSADNDLLIGRGSDAGLSTIYTRWYTETGETGIWYDNDQTYRQAGLKVYASYSMLPATTYYFRAWAYDSDSGLYSNGTSDLTQATSGGAGEYTYTGLCKLGSVSIANRSIAEARTSLGLLGVTSIPERYTAASKTALNSLGVNVLASGYKLITKLSQVATGITTFAERKWNLIRVGLLQSGTKITANRQTTTVRSGLNLLGHTVITSRVTATIRQAIAAIGHSAAADRIVQSTRDALILVGHGIWGEGSSKKDYTKSALIGLGVTSLAEAWYSWLYDSSFTIGIKVIASYQWASGGVGQFTYSALIKLGLADLADRLFAGSRTALVPVGISSIANRKIGSTRTGATTAGIKSIGNRAIAAVRTANATVGIKSIANRIIGFSRSAIAALGETVLAQRAVQVTRTGLALAGLATLGNRVVAATRTSLIADGVTVIANKAQAYVRAGLATVGIDVAHTGCLNFVGGETDYVNCGHGSSLDFVDKATLEIWTRCLFEGEGSVWPHYIGRNAFRIYQNGTYTSYNDIAAYVVASGVQHWVSICPDTVWVDQQWHHCVITFDSSLPSNNIKTYYDGKFYAQETETNTLDWNTSENFIIGGYFNYSMTGAIDQARVYHRALSATEVAEHQRGIFTDETNLVGLWTFDEGAGSIAYDASGNGNHGTITGATRSADGIPYAARKVAAIRTGLALIGVKVIANRVASSTKSALNTLGITTLAQRVVAAIRSASVADGIKVIANKVQGYTRAGLVQLGETVIASRAVGAIRTGLIRLGETVIADRIVGATRNSLIKLGLWVIASYDYIPYQAGQYTKSALIKLGIYPFANRLITSTRTALSLQGITTLGDRDLAAIRIGLISDGVKVIADRKVTLTRVGLVAAGIADISNREVMAARQSLVALGHTIIASRYIATIRLGLNKIGITVFASRSIGTIKAGLVLLGETVAANRKVAASRLGTAALGIKDLADHRVAASRSALVALGLKSIADRKTDSIRSALIKLGIAVIADFIYTPYTEGEYTYTALIKLGSTVIASRAVTAIRTSLNLAGTKVIGIKGVYGARTALVLVGIKVQAARPRTSTRSALLTLGEIVFAVRNVAASCLGLVGAGIKTIGQRQVSIIRPSLAKLGLFVLASYQATIHYTYASLVALGAKSIADRLIKSTRASLITIGIKDIAIRQVGLIRTGLISEGISTQADRHIGFRRAALIALGLGIWGTRRIDASRSTLVRLGLRVFGIGEAFIHARKPLHIIDKGIYHFWDKAISQFRDKSRDQYRDEERTQKR